jgi:hypothetical protein
MLDRVNVAIIVRDHFRTFYNYRDRVLDPRSSSLQKVDIGLNLLIPALIMAVLWCYDVTVPNSSLGTLITALAVFGALLFNLLILVYDVSGRETAGLLPEVARARKQTLLDLHANVAFAVLLALVSIVDLVIAAIGGKGPAVLPTSLAFYYLGALFLLTLLLILRRLHLLLGSDITKG